MLMVNQLTGFSTLAGLQRTWLGLQNSTTAATTYNFDFTTASGGLFIVGFGVRNGSNRTLSSITVGGNAATIHDQSPSSNRNIWGLASIVVPSAGTYTVAITFSAGLTTILNLVVGAWLLTGYASATPHFVDGFDRGSATSLVMTYNAVNGGFALFGSGRSNTSGSSWSSATELDENTTTPSAMAFAEKVLTATATGQTETVSWSGSNSNWGWVGVWI